MDQLSIKNVKNPIDKLDAVNKAYADRIKYKTASGNIPNTDEWIATSSPMFATEWPGFHKFSRGPSLMTFFSGPCLWLDTEFSPRLY